MSPSSTRRSRGARRGSTPLALKVTVVGSVAAAVAAVPALQSTAGTTAPAVQGRLAGPVTAAAHQARTAAREGAVLPGRYIVVLKDGSARSVTARSRYVSRNVAEARRAGVHVAAQYRHAFAAYAARMTKRQLSAVRKDRDVAYVEPDRVMSVDATQQDPDWGLDRLDQSALPLDHTYTSDLTGSGVTAYVIDTGIRASHTDFGGRVGSGFSAIQDGNGTTDCNGHGTHVAGTIGGTTYGVAKAVALVPVRVLGCGGSGSTSAVIQGVDWVTQNAKGSAVANMSLGGGASKALDDAVKRSIAAGVTYAVAAGNSNADACSASPARVPAALTVGATTTQDARAGYSNYGSCLDVFAPGSSIRSDSSSSDSATRVLSGTSMASPHVAGVAALVLQQHPGSSPADVAVAVVAEAARGVVTSAGSGSPDRLLQVPGGGAPSPTSPSPTSPSPTSPSPTRTSPSPTSSSPSSPSSTTTKPPTGGGGMSATEAAVLDIVNAERAKAGCGALAADATLVKVARAHSEDMATRNFVAHTNPDGLSPFDRMRAAGYTYRTAGENIAAGYATPAAVMTGLMNSAGHRANILNCAFKQIGIGYATGGPYRTYWTQDFGTH